MDRRAETWPELPYAAWKDTCETLHLWTQIVGKVRLAMAPPVNHWWHVTLYVTPRGLATGPVQCGERSFEVAFDFHDHQLAARTSEGEAWSTALKPRSVADMYRAVMNGLASLGVHPQVWSTPCEIPDPIPFEQDEIHAAYDPEYASRFHRVLVQSERVLSAFRGRFLGKVSPPHLFWGGLDLAITRFSGRRAPAHPPVPLIPDSVTLEAYSHEVSSAGFWPGAEGADALFYAYAYPTPEGFAEAEVGPAAARWDATLGEFVLPYAEFRKERDPDAALLEFLQATYEAAADLGRWDRAALER
jgi:hypothetical protein